MCSILTKQFPLNWQKIVGFYYRRLKRIVPVYLFTIFAVLIVAVLFVLETMDYLQMEKVVRKSLIFCSNIPNDTEKGYFERDKKEYNFFLHLWSLSLELQFYVLVPFLMIVLSYCNQVAKYLLVIVVAVISFLYQLRTTGDHEHMDLVGRIWQFMFGYLAYYIGQTNVPKRFQYILPLFVGHLIDTVLTILLTSLLFVQIIPYKQFNRLLVLTILLLLMSRYQIVYFNILSTLKLALL
jgi:peptidoglycan/LPS O-acetylase OafA/YrhL